ncbi:nucleoporin 88 [Zerene cesonia]|uniref:nucleoporin 88 n=1 Tax=Zerene cesonia TaxID=33412 RepID=UPI0018E50C66|nr:nucleoporin 88 [Zerene cesonia]
MDYQLYQTKLANHKIFKDLKDSLSKYSGTKLCNLIVLQDDVLYVWNSVEICLYCVNLKRLDELEEETPYQKLHLLSPPAFCVERLLSSSCGSRLCLWGSRGVTVAELPTRWGRGGLFESGHQTVLCKSFSLDERFLYSQGEVLRVHWHPKSLSHLLVLVSDNTMRLYNIALKTGPKMVKSFSIGPKPVGSLGMTLLDSFGDSAVDFTPTPDTEHLLILSGNGDVYMMNSNFLDSSSPLQGRVRGPLAMYPAADDNYGAESCALACLPAPPAALLVVASASATLYHCLLLPCPTENKDDDGYALYVLESVELNIALSSKDDVPFAYPVHLYPCPGNTYACMHAEGVHTITLPVLDHLKDLALADECEVDTALSLVSSAASSARQLVCCRAPGGETAPRALLVLCRPAELLARSLEPYDLEDQLFKQLQLKNPSLDDDDINKILKERQKLSFTTIIQEVLSREVSQPILKMNKSVEPSPKESLELLTSATVKLREQYMSRQQRAGVAVLTKLTALQALQQQQHTWHQELQNDIENVQLQAAVLLEKRNLAEKRQERIKERCSAVIRLLRSHSSSSQQEREMLQQLESYRQRAANMLATSRTLKEHADTYLRQIKEWREDYKKKDIALGKSHSDTISSILQQQTNQISTIIEETKLLKDQLGVV